MIQVEAGLTAIQPGHAGTGPRRSVVSGRTAISNTTAGELAALTGKNNPYPGKLGVIEEGALADILIVDGNPLEDITVIGANPKYFDAEPRGQGIETIRVIMKDGKIYKNTLN